MHEICMLKDKGRIHASKCGPFACQDLCVYIIKIASEFSCLEIIGLNYIYIIFFFIDIHISILSKLIYSLFRSLHF